jgi:phage/plasmid-associated DNA primase
LLRPNGSSFHTNRKPVIKGTDYGIWRWIKLIPFTTRIPEEQQDKALEEKLRKEASGILNWLLEGAKRWTVERLKTSQIITSATDEYRGEMDVIGNFIRARELFKCYQDWCDDNNERACSERFLGLRLKELGLEQKRLSDGRSWKGINVKSQPGQIFYRGFCRVDVPNEVSPVPPLFVVSEYTNEPIAVKNGYYTCSAIGFFISLCTVFLS